MALQFVSVAILGTPFNLLIVSACGFAESELLRFLTPF
jgi:hypothetical protein